MGELVTVAVPSSRLLAGVELPLDFDLTFLSAPNLLPTGADPEAVALDLAGHLARGRGAAETKGIWVGAPLSALVFQVAGLLAQPQMVNVFRAPDLGLEVAPSWPRPWPPSDRRGDWINDPMAGELAAELVDAQVWGVRNSPLKFESLANIGVHAPGVLAFVQGHGAWVAIGVYGASILIAYVVVPVARGFGSGLETRIKDWVIDFGRQPQGTEQREESEPDDRE